MITTDDLRLNYSSTGLARDKIFISQKSGVSSSAPNEIKFEKNLNT